MAPISFRRLAPLAFAAGAALTLAACDNTADKSYEADITDESGGDMIVTDATATGVPVEVPESEMTMVPLDEASATPEEPAPPPAQ